MLTAPTTLSSVIGRIYEQRYVRADVRWFWSITALHIDPASFRAKSAALSARQKSSSCLRFLSDLTSSFLLAASVAASFHLSMTPFPMMRDAEARGFIGIALLLRSSTCLNGDAFAADAKRFGYRQILADST